MTNPQTQVEAAVIKYLKKKGPKALDKIVNYFYKKHEPQYLEAQVKLAVLALRQRKVLSTDKKWRIQITPKLQKVSHLQSLIQKSMEMEKKYLELLSKVTSRIHDLELRVQELEVQHDNGIYSWDLALDTESTQATTLAYRSSDGTPLFDFIKEEGEKVESKLPPDVIIMDDPWDDSHKTDYSMLLSTWLQGRLSQGN